jgi:hypothetical protein
VNVAFFDLRAGLRLFDRYDDYVADARSTTLRPAQHFNALDALRAAIIRDV